MSFEGYYQILCENGHEHHVDCYMFDSDDLPACSICKADVAWWNLVDVTNGAYYNDERIDGYVDLKIDKEEKKCTCLECGNEHVSEHATYKIPETKDKP